MKNVGPDFKMGRFITEYCYNFVIFSRILQRQTTPEVKFQNELFVTPT